MEALGPDTIQEPAAPRLATSPEEGGPAPREMARDKLTGGASGGLLPGDSGVSRDRATFTLLGKLGSKRTLSNIQTATQDISDILSGEKEVGHLLCEGCTNLLEQLDAQLTVTATGRQVLLCCVGTG